MTMDYTYFQSAACDYNTYKYLSDGVIPTEWGLQDGDSLLRAVVIDIKYGNKTIMYVTNLPAADTTTDEKKIPTCGLSKYTTTDILDPTFTTLTAPAFNVDVYLTGANVSLTHNNINKIFKNLKNAQATVHEYWVKCDLRYLRNPDDGDFSHGINEDNFFKPVEINTYNGQPVKRESVFGSYLITDVNYDYDSSVLSLSGSHMAYELMNAVLTYERNSCMLPQLVAYDRDDKNTPYVYSGCFNLLDNMIGDGDPRCDYSATIIQTEHLENHLDLNQYVELKSNAEFPTYTIDNFIEKYPIPLLSKTKANIPVFKYLTPEYTMSPLYSYLSNTSLLDSFREFALLNDLFILPANYNYPNADKNQPKYESVFPFDYIKDGTYNGITVKKISRNDGLQITGVPIDPKGTGEIGTWLALNPGYYEISAKGGTDGLVDFQVRVGKLDEEPREIATVCCDNVANFTIKRGETAVLAVRFGDLSDKTPRNTIIRPLLTKVKIGAKDANWRVVGGFKPTDRLFPDKTQTNRGKNHLGEYYDTTSSLYFISPHCILTASDSDKSYVELPNVKYVNTTDVSVMEKYEIKTTDKGTTEVTAKSSTETFNLPEQVTNYDKSYLTSDNKIAGTTTKYPRYETLNPYTLPNKYAVALPDGKWYSTVGVDANISGGDGAKICLTNDISTSKIESLPTKNYEYLVNMIFGKELLNPYALYNPNLRVDASNGLINNLDDHKPLTAALRVVEPDKNKVNKLGEASTDNDENNHSVEMHFVSSIRHRDALPHIIDRVNANNMKPLYSIKWSMLDDPFLRIGSVVYFPLRDYYVKVLITEQTRSYTTGARLECLGWVIDETNIPTTDNTKESYMYANEVVAQNAVGPLAHNHWLRG